MLISSVRVQDSWLYPTVFKIRTAMCRRNTWLVHWLECWLWGLKFACQMGGDSLILVKNSIFLEWVLRCILPVSFSAVSTWRWGVIIKLKQRYGKYTPWWRNCEACFMSHAKTKKNFQRIKVDFVESNYNFGQIIYCSCKLLINVVMANSINAMNFYYFKW